MHALTRSSNTKLRIDLKAYEAPIGKGLTAYAVYDKFAVGGETSGYTLLEIDGYSGE